MKEKFIKKIDGKDFVLFEGLLDAFHTNGGKNIKTQIYNIENESCVVQAEVSGEKGTFGATGDASKDNTNKMVFPHYIRMAETRAIARAL